MITKVQKGRIKINSTIMSIIEINNVIQEITKLNIVKTNLMCMDE
jgi:hypothetical protein